MNKEQIKDLIASKIAGQGSAVDAWSALPEILNGMVEIIETQQALLDKYFFTGTLTNPSIVVSNGYVTELTGEEYEKLKDALVLWGVPRINIFPETILTAVADKAAEIDYNISDFNYCWGFLKDDGGEVVGIAYYISAVADKKYLVEQEINL